MLTPIQALLSAILTGFLVQLLTIRFYNSLENKPEVLNDITSFKKIAVNFPESLQLSKCPFEEPTTPLPVEVNKLLDAIFVTHAIEDENKIIDEAREETPTPITILNESNFQSIYTGDWLILAHVPWFDSAANYLQHFTSKFPEALVQATTKSSLNLATLDCHEHPFLSAVLQVRQYPALVLVTDSGRLRDWPFELKLLDQEALSFLVNRHWKHLPVYQLLKPSNNKQPFLFTTLQIRTFNLLTGFLLSKQPVLFNWITKNRPLTSGILGLASVLLYKVL